MRTVSGEDKKNSTQSRSSPFFSIRSCTKPLSTLLFSQDACVPQPLISKRTTSEGIQGYKATHSTQLSGDITVWPFLPPLLLQRALLTRALHTKARKCSTHY